MNVRLILILLGLSLLRPIGVLAAMHGAIQLDTLTLVDSVRHRAIPIAIYHLEGIEREHGPVVIISHGYNENLPGTYLRFSSLAEHLAVHGYTVVSIQHELPSDAPLAMKGDLRTERRPNWERGVANIHFVIGALKKDHPRLDLDRVSLVGHSNGGDISMLFAEQYPDRVHVALSLDNRRVPLPRTRIPHIASLRAEDVAADPGVLPTPEEQKTFGIQVIDMPGFKHVDFNDRGTREQRRQLNATVVSVLSGEVVKPQH